MRVMGVRLLVATLDVVTVSDGNMMDVDNEEDVGGYE